MRRSDFSVLTPWAPLGSLIDHGAELSLPKGSAGRPCDKCKANNKRTNAKAMASGARLKYKRSEGGKRANQKAQLKYKRSEGGQRVQQKGVLKYKRSEGGQRVNQKANQ